MKITVIITSLNSENYIERAIKSFLEQDYQDKELLIVDGKSTDRSWEIIEKYQKQNSKIIKWLKEKDSGISNARNIGIKYSTGDLIGFLGADDILHKDFFEKIPYYTSTIKNFDALYFNRYSISPNRCEFKHSSSIPFSKKNLIKHIPITSGEAFYYKKEIFNDFSFNEKNRNTMDYELNMALASSDKKQYIFCGVDIAAVFNVSDGNNISAILGKTQRVESIAIQLKYTNSILGKLRVICYSKKFVLKNAKPITRAFKYL